jgi:hypothetical protein
MVRLPSWDDFELIVVGDPMTQQTRAMRVEGSSTVCLNISTDHIYLWGITIGFMTSENDESSRTTKVQ